MEMDRWLFQGFTEIQNGSHRWISIFWGGAKIVGSIFFKFQHHIPSNMWMCKWFFKDATKIQNGRQKSKFPKFFVGAKTLKLIVRNYANFTITFPTIWRCAGDFFKVLLKLKLAATKQFNFFCGRKNSQTQVVNYSNFTITFPTIWRCACDFFKVFPKFKMAAMYEQKLTSEIMYRWFYWNLKWPPLVDFLNICDRKKL